jgi:hypothetical protein
MYSTRHSCQILIKVGFFDRYLKNIQISKFMKISAVEAELFHSYGRTDGGQTDRQTDRKTRRGW